MLISVIMATYNSEKSVGSAIKSIQNQTYTNWELIICDDCSSDNTYELLLEYSRKDKRISLFQNKSNMRLAYSLNRCLEAAKGNYIARMDDDDYSYPDRLKKQISFLEINQEFDFVSSGMDIYDGKKILYQRLPKELIPTKSSFLWNTPFVHAAAMFRTERLKMVNGYRIAKETRRCEDYDLFARMYAAGMKGYNIQECLYRCLEDDSAYKRRKYRYRIDEATVRLKCYKDLGLLPIGIPYIIKPLMIGLIPGFVLRRVRILIKDYR